MLNAIASKGLPPDRERPPISGDRLTGTGPLVLIVDDEQDTRDFLSEYFAYRGYRVATAENGEEALARAAKLGPDVILMDLFMPVLDGCEAARLLRSHPRTAAIPIIALTAHFEDLGQGARDAGCTLVLAKPASLPWIEQEVRRLLTDTS